jgi:hypothetical protein
MSCPVCPLKLTYDVAPLIHKACGSCQRQIKQMLAGFRGVMTESRPKKSIWDNTAGYEEWLSLLAEADTEKVNLRKKDDYVIQRCDLRDMKRIAGLPKFLPLEDQVYTAWINEGVKDEKIQEVLGLTYSQLFHVKKVIKIRLQKQMAYYHTIKKLDQEGKANETR